MKVLKEMGETLRRYKPFLREKFKVKEIGIFGSYVRGDTSEKSDVDILVEFYEGASLFDLVDLAEFLEELLGLKVDLVTKDALNPRIKDAILNEVIYF